METTLIAFHDHHLGFHHHLLVFLNPPRVRSSRDTERLVLILRNLSRLTKNELNIKNSSVIQLFVTSEV